jgi:hypothetical protein
LLLEIITGEHLSKQLVSLLVAEITDHQLGASPTIIFVGLNFDVGQDKQESVSVFSVVIEKN